MKAFSITKSITDRDSIKYYLKDVVKIPLLTPEEELQLAKKAKNGDKKAEDKLVISNLRFVISVAKQYQNQGLDFPDLINEGNIGLIKGVQHFDPDRGFKLISYVVWWIRQSITKALYDRSRTIRLPLSQIVLISKIINESKKFEQEHDRKPTNEELSEITDIKADKIAKLLEYNTRLYSIDTPFNSDDEDCGSYIDIIPNKNIDKVDKSLINDSINYNIANLLHFLSDREHDIIRLYFGLNCKQMTLEEIGRKFGLTKERIGQLREKALNKIKSKDKSKLKALLYA